MIYSAVVPAGPQESNMSVDQGSQSSPPGGASISVPSDASGQNNLGVVGQQVVAMEDGEDDEMEAEVMGHAHVWGSGNVLGQDDPQNVQGIKSIITPLSLFYLMTNSKGRALIRITMR